MVIILAIEHIETYYVTANHNQVYNLIISNYLINNV